MPDPASVARTRSDEAPTAEEMVWIYGGEFDMGSDHHYPEEAPRHRVHVDGFWMDRTPVTVGQFADFVRATGHVTTAEIAPNPDDYPGALPELCHPGSLVFSPPGHAVDLSDWSQWWEFRLGADWRHPDGPEATARRCWTTPLSTSPTAMRLPLRNGPGKDWRLKQSGSLRPGVEPKTPNSPGAISWSRMGGTSPTSGKGNFRGRTARHRRF